MSVETETASLLFLLFKGVTEQGDALKVVLSHTTPLPGTFHVRDHHSTLVNIRQSSDSAPSMTFLA